MSSSGPHGIPEGSGCLGAAPGRAAPGKHSLGEGLAGTCQRPSLCTAATQVRGRACGPSCRNHISFPLCLPTQPTSAHGPGWSSPAQTLSPSPVTAQCSAPALEPGRMETGWGRKGNETPRHRATENNHGVLQGRLRPVPRPERPCLATFQSLLKSRRHVRAGLGRGTEGAFFAAPGGRGDGRLHESAH